MTCFTTDWTLFTPDLGQTSRSLGDNLCLLLQTYLYRNFCIFGDAGYLAPLY